MVSLDKKNIFQLRDYYLTKINKSIENEPFKLCFLSFLGLTTVEPCINFNSQSLYQRSAISGFFFKDMQVSKKDLSILLGQAPKVESTPMQWASDVFGILTVKWFIDKSHEELGQNFKSWISHLSSQQSNNRFSMFENDIIKYIEAEENLNYSSACIPLFLHYQGLAPIHEHQDRQILIAKFFEEFKNQFQSSDQIILLSFMVYVFDNINKEVALTPPNGWELKDLVNFLKHIPVGLKRWTWESKGRTKNAEPVKWYINNEYHVQNLLYVLLAPVFNDISDELYIYPLGQKTPRMDLYLPQIHTIIEVKYRKDTKKSFANLIGEIAEDASLYRSDSKYNDSRIICFLWDHTRSTQEHSKFIEGVMRIQGIDSCVVVNSPSIIE